MPLLSPIVIQQEIDLGPLTSVSERAADLRPAWLRDVQPLITDFLTQRFDSEGAYLGEKWADLAKSTLRRRRRAGHGRGGIGRDTNHMWASFVKSAGSTPAPGGTLLIEKDRYERGSSVPYAQWFSNVRPIIPDPLPAQLVEQVEISLRAYIEGN